MTANTNSRIAANTALLYIRMLVLMGVGLYTSRLVLEALGDDGFGTYSIVAGFGVFIAFINHALTGTAQRFLCRDLTARGLERARADFRAAMAWASILSLAVVVVGTPVGMALIIYVLSIPAKLLYAAKWTYVLVIALVVVNLMRAPFAALVLARERMGFFSLTSVAEGGVKLGGVVILIYLWSGSVSARVIGYASIVLTAQLVVTLWYAVYCLRRFPEAGLSVRCRRRALARMGSFAGWNLFGGTAEAAVAQGGAMLVNIFYGVALNATTGLVAQIRTAVFAFTSSFQNASNPQIMKSYGEGRDSYSSLLCMASRLSYILMLLIAVPLCFNLGWVLNLWLDELPPALIPYTLLTVLFCLADSLSGSLWSAMQARGRMRSYQMSCGGVLLLNLPVAWLALRLGAPAQSVAAVQIGVGMILLGVRLRFARRYCGLSLRKYAREVVGRIAACSLLAIPVPALLAWVQRAQGGSFAAAAADALWTIGAIWVAGLTCDERRGCLRFIRARFHI